LKRRTAGLLAACLAVLLTACSAKPAPDPVKSEPPPGRPVEIIVSVAASLTDAMNEIQPAFEAEHPSVKLRFNFGSSGALQQQIEQGAPADLFISASPGPMESLVEKGFVEESAVANLGTNRVVLIRGKTADETVKTWEDLRSDRAARIAVGDPAHVPAGQYGRAVLENLGLWGAVQPRLVFGADVRQVLSFVESGEVQAGIVYSTDAAASRDVVVLAEAPEGSHEPVVYPMAVLKESQHSAEARAFADFLLSPAGMAILKKHGFGPAG
jgi:molybdate transport system substrate-binding protein